MTDSTSRLGPSGPLAGPAQGLKAAWWALLLVGIGWVVIGFVVLQFNGASVATVAALAASSVSTESKSLRSWTARS